MRLGPTPNWDEVRHLIVESYKIIAPKRLATQLEALEPSPKTATKKAPKKTAPKKTRAQEERGEAIAGKPLRSELCVHLRPIVDALSAAKIALKPIDSPYDDDSAWWACNCTFDVKSLRARLALDGTVTYYEYDGRVAGSDATFECKRHKMVIMGLHPTYAPRAARRLR
jgi:hypothetical protein